MRILNSVYGDSSGGRWSATLKTGELLAHAGHQLTLLIAPADLNKVPDYAGRKIDVVSLKNSGHYDLIASWKAARLIRDRKIDAIIAHSGRAKRNGLCRSAGMDSGTSRSNAASSGRAHVSSSAMVFSSGSPRAPKYRAACAVSMAAGFASGSGLGAPIIHRTSLLF